MARRAFIVASGIEEGLEILILKRGGGTRAELGFIKARSIP
jgi:hypothetical protein